MSDPKLPSYRGESSKSLTATERAILRALRGGLTLPQIAEILGRSLLTVRTHIRNARAKLDVRTTEDLRRRLVAGEFDAAIAEPGRTRSIFLTTRAIASGLPRSVEPTAARDEPARGRYASRVAAMRDAERSERRRERAERRRLWVTWGKWIAARDAGRDPGRLPPVPRLPPPRK